MNFLYELLNVFPNCRGIPAGSKVQKADQQLKLISDYIKKVPEKGEFDLNNVLKSTFFFSWINPPKIWRNSGVLLQALAVCLQKCRQKQDDAFDVCLLCRQLFQLMKADSLIHRSRFGQRPLPSLSNSENLDMLVLHQDVLKKLFTACGYSMKWTLSPNVWDQD